MSDLEKISLKAFWEAVEQRLAACSAEELRAILRAMAQETLPAGRQFFLDKLEPIKETAFSAQQTIQQEELLADIDDLERELKAAMEDADEWEERSSWGGYYDEEDSLGPYEKFIESLAGLFDRVEAAFDYGQLALARAAYEKLFALLDLEDDYGRGVQTTDLTGLDFGEVYARYVRAIYELEPPERRPQALFESMRQLRPGPLRQRMLLDDLIQISPRPLPDQAQFMTDWLAFLRTQSGPDADAWLREAVRLSQGRPGLEALARAEGKTRPRAYLDWFSALEQEGKQRELLLAAQAALQTLPPQLPIRAAIADYLCAAATRLNETESLRAGRWEAYLAKPALARLLDAWDAAPAGADRTALMEQAAQHARDYLAHPPRRPDMIGLPWAEDSLESPTWIDQSVLAHAYLLARDVAAAHQLAAGEKVLGWSSSGNPQGLVVAFLLALLSGRTPGALPTNLRQFWEERLQSSLGFRGGGQQQEDSVFKRLERAYPGQFAEISLSSDSQEKYLAWCLEVTHKRVEAIVSGQHRGSYDKAALLTAACAETLQLRGNRPAANALVDEIRNRFPRHRAFQADLKSAVQRMERDLR